MKYYYFPRSYLNRGKKKGGGRGRKRAVCGCGYMVAGSIKGGVADAKPIQAEALPKSEQKLIEKAEEKGEPVQIGEGRWKYWNGIKKVFGETWNGAKDVIGFTADTIGKLRLNPYELAKAYSYLKYPPGAGERIITNALGVSPFLASIMFKFMKKGAGYGKKKKKSWLKKGTPEAKAYMARLRAMRRN